MFCAFIPLTVGGNCYKDYCLIHCIPFIRNTCKLQLDFVEILEILLFILQKAALETHLV